METERKVHLTQRTACAKALRQGVRESEKLEYSSGDWSTESHWTWCGVRLEVHGVRLRGAAQPVKKSWVLTLSP